MIRLTEMAHDAVRSVIESGDCAIDATAGNGHDSVFLAGCVGPGGRVFGYDIQDAALAATRRRLDTEGDALSERVTLVQACHSEMFIRTPLSLHGRVACVMFNLGWLPGADHAITTQKSSTLRALDAALHLLRPAGVVTIVGYAGHDNGQREIDGLTERMQCDSDHVVDWQIVGAQSESPRAPRLFVGHRTGGA